MAKKLIVIVGIALCLSAVGAEPGAKKVALVIGNGAYESSPLKNPVQDARDIAAALSRLGFDVSLAINTDRPGFYKALRQFGNDIQGASICLFYFAGHGIQIEGDNYLMPIASDIQSADEVAFQCLDVAQVTAKMESAGCGTNIVILDACRDNPFWTSARGLTRGLAVTPAPKGSLLVYSTAPGQVAIDGEGENSYFAYSLLKHIEEDKDFETILREVRNDVVARSDGKQTPWANSSLLREIFLSAQGQSSLGSIDIDWGDYQGPMQASYAPAARIPKVNRLYWNGLKYGNYIELFEAINSKVLNDEFKEKTEKWERYYRNRRAVKMTMLWGGLGVMLAGGVLTIATSASDASGEAPGLGLTVFLLGGSSFISSLFIRFPSVTPLLDYFNANIANE